MVTEVETILNEIRERVRADQEQHSAPGTVVVRDETAADARVITAAENGSGNPESLSRLSAHLTTTSRAWDRLPPLYSNRTGMAARLELWIKARLKSLSRWFTWEQVNFNAAVHHALSDTLEALRTHEQELMRTRAEVEARLARLERSEHEIKAHAADMRSHTSSLVAQNVAIETRVSEANAAQANRAREIDERLAALAADLREEQRVCFKQLSLEASEAAVLEDRGRRAIESRLEKLEQPGTTHED